MQFGYTILYVDDVEATLCFYESAFGLARKFLAPGGEFGELNTGPTSLAFCSHALLAAQGKATQAPDRARPCSEVAFTTADVPAAVARATAAGAALLQPPEDMPWGQTVAYVADCNGFWVELCTPMAVPAA